MTEYYDSLETRDPAKREAGLFARLPGVLRKAAAAPAYAQRLAGIDPAARALGCAVIPAGPGNTDTQFELIEAYAPVAYSGTPDFLKILLDAGTAAGRDLSSIKRAVVSGAAFPPSLQEEIKSRGID